MENKIDLEQVLTDLDTLYIDEYRNIFRKRFNEFQKNINDYRIFSLDQIFLKEDCFGNVVFDSDFFYNEFGGFFYEDRWITINHAK